MDTIYEEHRSDWSQQVSALLTAQWLQCDQTLPFSAKGVGCETREDSGGSGVSGHLAVFNGLLHNTCQLNLNTVQLFPAQLKPVLNCPTGVL